MPLTCKFRIAMEGTSLKASEFSEEEPGMHGRAEPESACFVKLVIDLHVDTVCLQVKIQPDAYPLPLLKQVRRELYFDLVALVTDIEVEITSILTRIEIAEGVGFSRIFFYSK